MSNIIDIRTPEFWASPALDILVKNLVLARLVNRNFEDRVARLGDKIYIRRPDVLTVRTWSGVTADSNEVVDKTALTTTERPTGKQISVTLDTFSYVSFVMEDLPVSVGLPQLEEEYFIPAADPLAESIDTSIGNELCSTSSTDIDGNAVSAISNEAGSSDGGAPLTEDNVIYLHKVLNDSKVPQSQRRLVLCTDHEADLLARDLVHRVDQAGSDDALRNAALTRIFGFDVYMSQNIPTGPDDVSGENWPQSIAFRPEACVLASRPLSLPEPGTGVMAATANYQNLSMRITKQYDQDKKATTVDFDVLTGVQLVHAARARVVRP